MVNTAAIRSPKNQLKLTLLKKGSLKVQSLPMIIFMGCCCYRYTYCFFEVFWQIKPHLGTQLWKF